MLPLRGHRGTVNSLDVASSPSSSTVSSRQLLLSGSADGTARLWDVARSRSSCVRALQPPGSLREVSCVRFLDDNMVCAATSNTVFVYDLRRSDIVLHHADHVLKTGNDAEEEINSVSCDGDTLAIADDAGDIWVWDQRTYEFRHKLAGHHTSICSSIACLGNNRLVSGGLDTLLFIWDLPSQQMHRPLPLNPTAGTMSKVAVHRQRKAAGKKRRKKKKNQAGENTAQMVNPPFVNSIAVSKPLPLGEQIIIVGLGNSDIGLFSLSNANMFAKLKGHTAPIGTVRLSASNHLLVSASNDRFINLWDWQRVRRDLYLPQDDSHHSSGDDSKVTGFEPVIPHKDIQETERLLSFDEQYLVHRALYPRKLNDAALTEQGVFVADTSETIWCLPLLTRS